MHSVNQSAACPSAPLDCSDMAARPEKKRPRADAGQGHPRAASAPAETCCSDWAGAPAFAHLPEAHQSSFSPAGLTPGDGQHNDTPELRGLPRYLQSEYMEAIQPPEAADDGGKAFELLKDVMRGLQSLMEALDNPLAAEQHEAIRDEVSRSVIGGRQISRRLRTVNPGIIDNNLLSLRRHNSSFSFGAQVAANRRFLENARLSPQQQATIATATMTYLSEMHSLETERSKLIPDLLMASSSRGPPLQQQAMRSMWFSDLSQRLSQLVDMERSLVWILGEPFTATELLGCEQFARLVACPCTSLLPEFTLMGRLVLDDYLRPSPSTLEPAPSLPPSHSAQTLLGQRPLPSTRSSHTGSERQGSRTPQTSDMAEVSPGANQVHSSSAASETVGAAPPCRSQPSTGTRSPRAFQDDTDKLINFLAAALDPINPPDVTEGLTASDTHHPTLSANPPLPGPPPSLQPIGQRVLPPLISLSSLPSLNVIPSLPSVPSSNTSTEPLQPLLPLTSDQLQALARRGEAEELWVSEGAATPSILNLEQSGGLQDYIINNDLFR